MIVLFSDVSFQLTWMEALTVMQAVRVRLLSIPSPGLLSSEWEVSVVVTFVELDQDITSILSRVTSNQVAR